VSAAAATLLFSASVASAQEATGALTGTVLDQTNAVLGGAHLELRDDAGVLVQTATSDGALTVSASAIQQIKISLSKALSLQLDHIRSSDCHMAADSISDITRRVSSKPFLPARRHTQRRFG
jgi:hypothetical protein